MSNIPLYQDRRVSMIVRALLAIGVLWLLFDIVEPARIQEALEGADSRFFLAALLLVPLHLTFRVIRWHLLLRASGIQESLLYTARVVLAGYAFSAVTPGEIGDFFVRTRFHGHSSRGMIPALVLLDKMLQGILIVLAGIPALVLVGTSSAVYAWGAFFILIVLLFSLAAGRTYVLRHRAITWLASRFHLEGGVTILTTIARKVVLMVSALSVCTLVTFSVQEYLLLRGFETVTYMTAWIGYWCAMSVQMLFPFFLAGLGIREGAHVYFFGLLGVEAPVALSASLLLFTINILLPSLAGLVVFFTLKRRPPSPD